MPQASFSSNEGRRYGLWYVRLVLGEISVENLLNRLNEMTKADRKAPKKTYLEEAWDEIQREVDSLSRYPYIDDQLEICKIAERRQVSPGSWLYKGSEATGSIVRVTEFDMW